MQQTITIIIVAICVMIVIYRIFRRFSRKNENPCGNCPIDQCPGRGKPQQANIGGDCCCNGKAYEKGDEEDGNDN